MPERPSRVAPSLWDLSCRHQRKGSRRPRDDVPVRLRKTRTQGNPLDLLVLLSISMYFHSVSPGMWQVPETLTKKRAAEKRETCSFCLSVILSISISVYPSFCLSAYQSFCLSPFLSAFLSIRLSVYLYFYLFVFQLFRSLNFVTFQSFSLTSNQL